MLDDHPLLTVTAHHVLSEFTLTLVGEFDGFTAPLLDEQIAAAPARTRQYIIEASGLTFAGADFINAMLRLRQEHGQVCVHNPSPLLRRLFAITGVDDYVVVRAT